MNTTAGEGSSVGPKELAEVAALCDGATRESEEQWEARCPAHEDSKPSLRLVLGTRGLVRGHCQAGCVWPDVRAALVARGARDGWLGKPGKGKRSTGLRSPLNKVARQPVEPPAPLPPALAFEMYGALKREADRLAWLRERRGLTAETIDGALVGWSAKRKRYAIPVFDDAGDLLNVRYYLPDATPDDVKIRNAGGGRGTARLYVPGDVLRSGPVLLCAGELDALLAWQHGWNAATFTCGEGNVPKPEHLEPLRGREVTVIYDNDDTGNKGAEKAAAALADTGSRPRIGDLSGLKLGKGGDVTDLLRRKGGDAKLRRVVREAKAWKNPTTERFAVVTPQQLAQPVEEMRWAIRGVWPDQSHGPLAGAKKSFKSYNVLALAVAWASGKPYLNRFDVETPGRVLIYNGEGGERPFRRRLHRMCEAYGVRPEDLPLYSVFDTGPLDSDEFGSALARNLEAVKPSLVILDPLYTYHPAGVEAQNLYERGRMLSDLSSAVGHDTALIVVDHYRKTGAANLDLDEIGQSGVAQWADSWILQGHREPPDLAAGSVRLAVEYGSRQWGGARYGIDWELGAFDEVQAVHTGDIAWNIGALGERVGKADRHDGIRNRILIELRDRPLQLTKTEVKKAVAEHAAANNTTCSTSAFDRAWSALEDAGDIVSERAKVPEGPTRRLVERPVWRAAGTDPVEVPA